MAKPNSPRPIDQAQQGNAAARFERIAATYSTLPPHERRLFDVGVTLIAAGVPRQTIDQVIETLADMWQPMPAAHGMTKRGPHMARELGGDLLHDDAPEARR